MITPASNDAPPATPRERFLSACRCQPVDRPPVWLMRQAGRVLPEYRALKERHSFVELVRTPELATEVTLQPVRRFGFDAAILFSDILVIPEALGQPYAFQEGGGIRMAHRIDSADAVRRLEPGRVRDHLHYADAALRLIRRELGDHNALIGFSGAPWTLACFMVEGGSSEGFPAAHRLLREDPSLYDALAERLTGAIIEYLHLQCDAGAEVVQVFDTLAGALPRDLFERASGQWLRRIVSALTPRVPVILFAKSARVPWSDLAAMAPSVLSVDAEADLAYLRATLPPGLALQGNLAPAVLTGPEEGVRRETRRILEVMRGRPGHIFNLGHGVPPDAPLANLETLVHTLRTSP